MRLIKNLALFCFVLLLCFCLLELIFRLTRKDDALKVSVGKAHYETLSAFTPHSKLHLLSQSPGEFDTWARINNLGLRGEDVAPGKNNEQKRIFLIGDSFTFGVGAQDNETIPVLLEEELLHLGSKAEVINLGRGHDSPLTYFLRLRNEIPALQPDVIVMLIDFSDLWDDWNTEKHLVFDADGKIVGANPFYLNGKFSYWNFARSKSVFLSYVHNKLVRTAQKIGRLGLKGYIETKAAGKKAKAAISQMQGETIAFDGLLFLRGRDKEAEIRKHFERTAGYILRSRDMAESAGVEFILMTLPRGIHIGPDQWGKGRTYWGFEAGKTYSDYFAFDLIREFSEKNNIPHIDALDIFLAHKDKELFFDHDGHFTPTANRIAAFILAHSPELTSAI